MLGEERFGAAPTHVASAVQAIADLARLERMTKRVLTAAGWDDLLATL